MKTIATFTDTATASIAQGMLKNNGINSIIDNQAMSSLYPTPITGLWDVRLVVNDEDAPKAEELLREHGDID
ncbi:MAG: DUF2007 domain-containing protein [Bacteroides sp.]|nr:DUF2007 domain-containing protein [Bacteroides sp.]